MLLPLKILLDGAGRVTSCRLVAFYLVFCSLFLCFFSSAASFQPSTDSKIDGRNVTVNGAKLDSSVDEIQWCGTDHSTLLLRTIQNRLYRSFDSGKTWNDISDLFRVSKDGEEEIVEVESISVNPVEKNIIVFHSWMFHPTKPKWSLLAGISDECYQSESSNSSNCNRRLFITKDLGRTISLVSNYVVQFNWGDVKHSQEDRIYYSRHRSQKGNQFTVGGWSSDVDFVYTDNFGKSTTVLVPSGNKFVVSNEYIFVAAADDIAKQTVEMKVSIDGAKTFSTSKLSTEIQQKSYSVLDVSEGAIMLHVNHGEDGKSDTGNVYVSDASGTHFSLSLPGNIRTATGECEFDKVMSLEGVYLANFKEELEGDISSIDHMEDSIIEDEEENAATEVEKKRHPKSKAKNQEVIRTVVSFDKGGAWYYVKPPEEDSLGQKVECTTKHCSLHLHGITTFTQYAPFYSMQNAVGIILSTGNVGSHLSYDTSAVIFSWNEGRTWYDFDLNGGPIEVNNIVIEPNSSTLEFLLYGTRGDEGVVYHMDFKSLGQKYCKGLDEANTWNSDYETWIPSGIENEKIFG
ncbi:putative sortilin [Cardiosporidium cionae]|uniref:Sortilin n=1 Tax=Cardiosporidium cionae TaxID=476202 RepID=A0ABQ7J4L8_9APIC|nr:putative sortilin [Cardiosporidium cionae]|eukprot:KAF8818378.1 putative sortilin [Cardiosporidium cionae]